MIKAEKWDAYDEQFRQIEGVELIRGESIPEGMFHLDGEIIVKHVDGTYLLMQRDYKKHFGGMWELTAGGSALKGENALECAKRELLEETGIVSESLIEIDRNVHKGHHSLYVEFLCCTDCDKHSVILQEGETIAYRWVDRDTLLKMDTNEIASARMIELVKSKNL